MNKLKSSKKAIAFVLTMLMILGVGFPRVSFADTPSKIVDLNIMVNKETVKVGEEFTYTIRYSYSSNDEAFENEQIIFSLPKPMKFLNILESTDVESYEVTTSALPGTSDAGIIVSMKKLNSGTTGFIKITAYFEPGSILGPTSKAGILTNHPTANPTASAIVPTVTADVDTELTWSLTKEKILPAGETSPAYGGEAEYKISVRGNNAIGGIPLEDVKVIDVLPVGTEFVEATTGYTATPSTSPSTLEWKINKLMPGELKTFNVTVRYPSDYPSTTAINTAQIFVTKAGIVSTKAAFSTHSVTTPGPVIGTISKWSRQPNDRYSVGQQVVFYIGGYNNKGNISIDEMEIVDEIPDGINLQSVTVGNAKNVKVFYSTYIDQETFIPWTTPSTLPDGLGINHIKKVKWVMTNVPVGFVGAPLRISGKLLENYREELSPSAVVTGNSITNTVTFNATKGSVALTSSKAIETITVGSSDIMSMPWLSIMKFSDIPPNVNKRVDRKSEVTYTIRIKNNDYATGDLNMDSGQSIIINDLPNPIMKNYKYISLTGSAGASIGEITGSGITDGGVNITATAVEWTWTKGELKPGEYIDITYTTEVDKDALVGPYLNTATVTTSGIFLDPRSTSLSAVAKVFVRFSGSLKSSKGIKGHNDSKFKYPSPTAITTETLPGGTVRYQLKVNNGDSNGPITNVVMIDKFPHDGDTGVIVPFGRESKWSPYLVNIVTGKDGNPLTDAKVYYSTSPTPDTSKLSNPLGSDTGWSLTPPALITSVTAIKIEFGNKEFKPNGEPIYVEWDMRVPVSFNPGDYNKIANNSFAFGATYTDENASGDPIQLPFLPSEPTKVGAKLTSPSAGTFAIGDFIWEDINKDGIQGASEPGINGITVNLYKDGETSPSAFTITANNFDGKPGYYNFPNLDNGKYHVEFVMPKDYFITNLNATGGALDSDFELSGSAMDRKYIATVTLSGSDCLDIDAGIYRLGSIGDMVFNDRNFNAVYNNSIDKGVSGASVKLYRITGGGVTEGATYWNGTGFVSTTAIITDSTGKYKFDGLDPGEYIVEFTMPNDSFKFVTPGSIDRADNDSNVQTNSTASGTTVGRTEKVELKSGENRVDIDAGIYLGQIGDRVWHDINGNGIQETTEPGINGVTVQLYNSDGTTLAKDAFGNTVAAVTTSATGGLDGIYYFNDLGAGDYVVKFITPAGYNITKKNATTSALDSNADPKTGLTSKVTLTAGSQDITVDCGLYNFVSIGDFVFNDLNANGIQDGGEGGITGVAVTLYRVTTGGVTIPATYWDGSPVQDIITTGSGFYLFDRIDPGEYRVQFKTTDSAFMATKANVGGNDTKDSDGIPTTTNYSVVLTDSYKLDSGDSNPNVDQGFFLIQPGIEIEKTVYANTDGGIGTGTHLIARKAGTPLTYMFKITNTGNTYLSDIEIDDIQLGITLGGMKIKSGSLPLAPNATLVAYYETTLTNDIKNTAVTTGTAVYDATGTAIPGMVKPTDSVWQKQGP